MQVSLNQLKRETNQLVSPKSPKFDNVEQEVIEEKKASPKEKSILKTITAGNLLGPDTNLAKRKEMLDAKGFEPTEFAFERAIGRNDSLYSNFTELIALTKRKVGRIVIIEENKRLGYATGFMVSPTLLLTNWHVFREKSLAVDSEVHFLYEYNTDGHPQSPIIFKFDTRHFYSDELLDYCFVGVQPIDVTGNFHLQNIGSLYLDKSLGKIGKENEERLNIIHHPLGDYKQLSIRENLFVDIDETKIYYHTDTAQGSSGSPVFNDQWQVVGLHHKSNAKMTPDGENYLDKDDKIIPIIDGTIDITRIIWLKNEGMRISVILKHLAETYPDNETLSAINNPPPAEKLSFTISESPSTVEPIRAPLTESSKSPISTSGHNINIQVPVDALSRESSIEISLSKKPVSTRSQEAVPSIVNTTRPTDELLLEIAKADKEDAMDFSTCGGYKSNFLGVEVPLPQPKKILEKELARQKNKKTELKYYKYSVLFSMVRRMPILSAVNVEGDPSKRLDNSTRRDDWLRDKRIDKECQLTDKFYSRSNFEKGHMSRFEDANWDNTEEAAFRNGIFTCFYTNACPQVKKLNGPGGMWGKLEKAILEKGIKKETHKQARMTVFNGPIFSADKDRIFRGVTIPMEFFKIVLWLDDDNNLKATAFKLTQEPLVSIVDFDESFSLMGEEALDADKIVAFKNFQCSIKSLSRLTNIQFKELEKFDTFKPGIGGGEEVLLENEAAIIL